MTVSKGKGATTDTAPHGTARLIRSSGFSFVIALLRQNGHQTARLPLYGFLLDLHDKNAGNSPVEVDYATPKVYRGFRALAHALHTCRTELPGFILVPRILMEQGKDPPMLHNTRELTNTESEAFRGFYRGEVESARLPDMRRSATQQPAQPRPFSAPSPG